MRYRENNPYETQRWSSLNPGLRAAYCFNVGCIHDKEHTALNNCVAFKGLNGGFCYTSESVCTLQKRCLDPKHNAKHNLAPYLST